MASSWAVAYVEMVHEPILTPFANQWHSPAPCSDRNLFNARICRWVLIACGAALLFFGVSFVIAGLRFLTTGEVSLG